MPYKSELKEKNIYQSLQEIFDSVSSRAEQYSELGSSHQFEHANNEVTLRAPKSYHYGNSESLVHDATVIMNEGMSYISQVKKIHQ